MEKVFRVTIFLGLFLSTFTREILNYVDGTTSRREDGDPGSKVTGEWSWMDLTGKEHTIRYIADTNGFRAFGDLVPQDWSTSDNNYIPQIGSSVVPAVRKVKPATFNINSNFIHEIPNSIPLESVDRTIPNIDAIDLSQISSSTSTDSKSEVFVSDNDILTLENPNIPNDPVNLKPFLILPDNTEVLESEKRTISEMNDMKIVFIPGTNIVLLSKRLPSTFATEISPTGEIPIKPRPVKMTGLAPKTITGILTAPRAKVVLLKNTKAKNFQSPAAGRAPRPQKVDGMLNLDNFLRPAHLPNSHPKVSLIPDPKVVVPSTDYFYDDYYYYDDYTNTGDENSTKSSSSPSSSSSTNSSSSSTNSSSSSTTSSSSLTSTTSTTTSPPTTTRVQTTSPTTSSPPPPPSSSTTITIRQRKPFVNIFRRKKSSWKQQKRLPQSEESVEDSDESSSESEDSNESK